LYRESNHDSYDSHLYRTIRLRFGSKNDTSHDSYHGGAISYRIVRFVSWIVRYLLQWWRSLENYGYPFLEWNG